MGGEVGMDIEQNREFRRELKESFKAEGSPPVIPKARAKSANRIRYEAEVELLKRKLGDLESIRQKVGLSQRKMCQLLFVDPSAWTRWTKGGESAPPYVYRALQWYLALNDKYPALDVNFWLGTATRGDQAHISETQSQQILLKNAVNNQTREVSRLKNQVRLLVIGNLAFAMTLVGILAWLFRS